MKRIDEILCEMRKDIPRVVDAKVILRNYADRLEESIKSHLREATKKEEVAVAENAITTPRRNCDVYTMIEQSKRHEEYCKSHSTNGRCVKCPLWQMRLLGINCAIAWVNLPYEKEGEK